MTGHHYPDNLYADALARDEKPLGAYRSTDPVTKPAHYQRAGIETIDYIRATLTAPGFEAYCIGNVLKYVSRYREKGGIEDLRKAQVYLGWAIEPVKPEDAASVREAKVAYDMACNRSPCAHGIDALRYALSYPERVPRWHVAYAPGHEYWAKQPPNCDGLSARDIRSPHPMAAEAIRDHDERLSGAEDRL